MTQDGLHDQGARRHLDLTCGAILALLSLIALVWVIPVSVKGSASDGEVSPAFFPNLTAGVVFVCALAMVVVNRSALRLPVSCGGKQILLDVIGWGLLATAIMVLLTHVGFVAASILATAVATLVTRYRGRRRINMAIAIAAAIALPFLLRLAVQALFSIDLP